MTLPQLEAAPQRRVSRDLQVRTGQVQLCLDTEMAQVHQESRASPVTITRVSRESSDCHSRPTVMRQAQGLAVIPWPGVGLQGSEVRDQSQARLQRSSGKD